MRYAEAYIDPGKFTASQHTGSVRADRRSLLAEWPMFPLAYAHHARINAEKRQNNTAPRNRIPTQAALLTEARERLGATHQSLIVAGLEHAAQAARDGHGCIYFKMAFGPWVASQAQHFGDADAKLVFAASAAPIFAESRMAADTERQSSIDERVRMGFVHDGGVVAGYSFAAMRYHGLVSNEDPIYQLFVTKTHRVQKLRVGWDKAESWKPSSKLIGLDAPYVEGNKAMRGFFRGDLDVVFASWIDLSERLERAGIPQPNVGVGYEDASGRIHKPHLIWLLKDSVAFTEAGRRVFQNFWTAVLRALSACLLPVGGDPNAMLNPMRVKNPLCPLWGRQVFRHDPWSLSTLREALADTCPLHEADARLSAGIPHRPVADDHPDPMVAGQSNRIFAALSVFARSHVGAMRNTGDYAAYEGSVLREARELSGTPASARAMSVVHIATRIAAWTWENWVPRLVALPKSPLERMAACRAGQSKGASTKVLATRNALRVAWDRVVLTGLQPTQQAVMLASGRGIATVKRHWATLRHHVRPDSTGPALSEVCPPNLDARADGQTMAEKVSFSPIVKRIQSSRPIPMLEFAEQWVRPLDASPIVQLALPTEGNAHSDVRDERRLRWISHPLSEEEIGRLTFDIAVVPTPKADDSRLIDAAAVQDIVEISPHLDAAAADSHDMDVLTREGGLVPQQLALVIVHQARDVGLPTTDDPTCPAIGQHRQNTILLSGQELEGGHP